MTAYALPAIHKRVSALPLTLGIAYYCFGYMGWAASDLSLPWQEATVPAVFSKANNTTLPRFTNGYFLSFARTALTSRGDVVFVTAPQTQVPSIMPLRLPGTSAVRIETGAVSPTGHVLVAGSYYAADNTSNPLDVLEAEASAPAPRSRAGHFMAELDPSSAQLVQVVDTGTYTPERLCVAPDRTLWTFGQDWSREVVDSALWYRQNNLSPALTQDYFLVRHWTSAGAFIQGYLPMSQVKGKAPFSRNYHAGVINAGEAIVSCGETAMGIYVSNGRLGHLWTLIDFATGQSATPKLVRNPKGTSGEPAYITGLALLSPGAVYASFGTGDSSGTMPSGNRNGVFRLMQGAAGLMWEPVTLGGGNKTQPSLVLGMDGSSLVYLVGDKPGPANATVYWTTAQ